MHSVRDATRRASVMPSGHHDHDGQEKGGPVSSTRN